MSSSYTIEKLQYLLATKEAIKEAIIEKGQTVDDTDTFRSYVEKIQAIQTATEYSNAEDCSF